MKLVPVAISSRTARQLLLFRKASPNTLFVLGIVGAVTSTVLACRATLRLEETVDKIESDLNNVNEIKHFDHYDTVEAKKDRAYVYLRGAGDVVKLYAPAIVIGGLSIAALTGSHNLLNKRNASLTAAYAAVEKSFAEYRKRVSDKYGEDEERELRYPLEQCEIETTDPKTGKVTKENVKRIGPGSRSMYAKFFGRDTSQYWSPEPFYNVTYLKQIQNHLNDRLRAKGHLFLNEVYDDLGLERSKAGQIVGWIWKGDGDSYVDFGIFNEKMEPHHMDFFTGREDEILLDFNVDGPIYDLI